MIMGASVIKDHWGGTPLHDAAENGELEVHKYLYIVSSVSNAVAAALNDRLFFFQCCRALLNNHISPLERDLDGFTAVDLAEYNGYHDCANFIRAGDPHVRSFFSDFCLHFVLFSCV